MVNLFQTFVFKLICLIIFYFNMCAPINNGSTMSPFAYKTNVRINSFRVNHKDISLIIKSLNSNKAHGTNKKDTNLR